MSDGLTSDSKAASSSSGSADAHKLKQRRRVRDSCLRVPGGLDKWPIVYSSKYNISCYGIEKLHPFDSQKWGKVFGNLKDTGWLTEDDIIEPNEAQTEDLLMNHVSFYLNSLKIPCQAARAVEVGVVAILPTCLIEKCLLRPMRFQVGGTVAAGYQALERGWSVNIGGGFHHSSSNSGGGFCVYNDVSIAIQFLFNDTRLKDKVKKVMIVDLDAHQGNGNERDFKGDKRVYIMDMFNYKIYPRDYDAKEAISKAVRLKSFTEDGEYLRELKKHLTEALAEFHPDIIFYNAGTDCFEADPLGCLSISEKGIITRDEFVFRTAIKSRIPIAMVTSGGYTKDSARIIANSLINLKDKGLIRQQPGFADV